ncbi:MAG: nucleotidyltransferase domain-containing protein, partial [Candidatus Bathyarchaeia archaeon]
LGYWIVWREICLVHERLIMAVQTRRLRMLLEWRNYLPLLAEAVREVLTGAEIYVFGSALEGNLTVDSDIDVLIIVDSLPGSGLERARLIDKIWRAMEKRGIPPHYPFEIQLITRGELKLLEKQKLLKIP